MALAHHEPPADVPKPIRLYVEQQIADAKQEFERRLVDHQTEMERYYAVRYDEVLIEVKAMRADQSRILEILEDQSRTLSDHSRTLNDLHEILKDLQARD